MFFVSLHSQTRLNCHLAFRRSNSGGFGGQQVRTVGAFPVLLSWTMMAKASLLQAMLSIPPGHRPMLISQRKVSSIVLCQLRQ